MKLSVSAGRKLKYGGTSVALTALVLALVIIVNVFFAMLVQRYSWYVDLTPDLHFTISDECYELIGGSGEKTPIKMLDKFRAENKEYNKANGLTSSSEGYRDENVKVTILFGMERDKILGDQTMEYVLRNADELAAKYKDYITVETKDMVKNPSRFKKYLSSNTETIPNDSVIIECGSEYRIRSLRSFYLFDKTSGEPVAYNGEKAFAASILAVTRAEVPLACYTINHGEHFPDQEKDDEGNITSAPFLEVLEDAGYRVQPIDLLTEEIPETCRLLITFDPTSDFVDDKDPVSGKSELDKLDDYLAKAKAFMVFRSPTPYEGTKKFEILEDFLGEWGLEFKRDSNGEPFKVHDEKESIGGWTNVIGNYVDSGVASGWNASLTSGEGSNPYVVFSDSVAIGYAEGYPLGYSSTYKRQVYDLFTSSKNAYAMASDKEAAKATEKDPFKLMAVSAEKYSTQVDDRGSSSDAFAYVMLSGSTEFASRDNLEDYANDDFLLSAFQLAGQEPVPVGLDYKRFANYEITAIKDSEATQYMMVLTLVPVLISLCAGVFVIVRRKNR